MSACPFQDDLDDSAFASKAVWRRQNSEKLACRHASKSYGGWTKNGMPAVTRRRCLRHFARGQKSNRSHAHKVRAAKSATDSTASLTTGKAEWHVELPDWFRSTLSEHGEFSTLLDPEEGDEDDDDCVPVCLQEACLQKLALLAEDGSEKNVSGESNDATPSSASNQRPKQQAVLVDASVECCPEDIVDCTEEMMASSPFGHFQCLRKMRTAALHCELRYSVASHFSLFEDPLRMAAYAGELSPAEVATLADRFLGREIAGVAVQRGCRSTRRVAERHTEEAALIADATGTFRADLLVSAERLFLGGFAASPFHGKGLLQLAHGCPEEWAKLTYTAMHFAGHLIQAGALPAAFAAELLAGLAALPPTTESGKMLVLGLLIVIPAVRLSRPSSPMSAKRSLMYGRARSLSGLFRMAPIPLGVKGRSVSAPASMPGYFRTIGTCLHIQDDFQPYAFVSVNHATRIGVDRKYVEVAPPIDPRFLPDYWRFAAGGEHRQEELERRACRADEDLEVTSQESPR